MTWWALWPRTMTYSLAHSPCAVQPKSGVGGGGGRSKTTEDLRDSAEVQLNHHLPQKPWLSLWLTQACSSTPCSETSLLRDGVEKLGKESQTSGLTSCSFTCWRYNYDKVTASLTSTAVQRGQWNSSYLAKESGLPPFHKQLLPRSDLEFADSKLAVVKSGVFYGTRLGFSSTVVIMELLRQLARLETQKYLCDERN